MDISKATRPNLALNGTILGKGRSILLLIALVEAARMYKTELSDFSILMAGDGSLVEHLASSGATRASSTPCIGRPFLLEKGVPVYHLAQVNIARMIAPLSDPRMAGFVAKLAEVNALADASPGFIWRLQTPEGDATAVRAYEDERILFNLSVWRSVETFAHFVYATTSAHRYVLQQRRRWFERFDGAYQALWWIPPGHLPTIAEAKERLDSLRVHQETAFAFSLTTTFPAPDAQDAGQCLC